MKTGNQRAFTLIEMLVVIAIIGILAAIMIPSLSTARASARAAQCTSNLKNLGVLLHQYSTRNKDYVTPAMRQSDAGLIWACLLYNMQKGVPKAPPHPHSEGDAWKQGMADTGIFYCPGDTNAMGQSNNGIYSNEWKDPTVSYALNWGAHTPSANWVPPQWYDTGFRLHRLFKMSQIRNPSQLIYCGDAYRTSDDGEVINSHAYGVIAMRSPLSQADVEGMCDTPSAEQGEPWHPGKTWNYLFIDGHAERKRPEDTVDDGGWLSTRQQKNWINLDDSVTF